MIFDDTKELLQKTENVILDVYEGRKRWLSKVDKIVNCNTVGFICTGVNSSLTKRIFFVTIVVFLFFTLTFGVTGKQLIVNLIFSLLTAIILSPLVIFSKSLDDDVKSKDVEQIKKVINEKELSATECRAIKENLLIMKAALESKTSMSRWIVAAIWAVFLYFLMQYFIPPVINGEPVKMKTLQLVGLGPIFILTIYSLERCFSRTSRRVFMTLFFALNEPKSKG